MANVSVKPNNPGNTHEIAISGLGRTWGIKLERGAKSIVEAPVKPSNIERGGGVKKYGDFDPNFAHIEMRTWEGGRGGEFLSDDPTKYADGYGWSLSPGVWHQAPQWHWGEGYYVADNLMPGSRRRDVGNSVRWRSLASTTHLARSFVDQGDAYAMTRAQLWVRRIGTPPAPLSLRLATSASDRPSSAAVATATLNSTDTEALESFVWEAQLSSAGNTTQSGTTTDNYWLEVFTTAAGTAANHWEVGYNSSAAGNGSTSLIGDGTSGGWAASSVHFYFRVIPEPLRRKWHFFHMDRALYAIDERKDRTSDTALYINGDRGKCSSNATTAAVTDGTKAWPANLWNTATVAIIRGPGSGQSSPISTNLSTIMGVSLQVAPTSESEYVIYDTHEWTGISSAIVSSIGNDPVKSVAVAGNVAYFAFGNSTHIGRLTWATSVHQAAKDSTNFADHLDFFASPVTGPELWRAISSLGEVSRASLPSTFSSAMSFSSGIAVGSTGYPFTNLKDYNDQMFAFKEDSIWVIKNDRASKLNIGLDAFASSNNGRAAMAQNLFLFMSWSHSLERLYQGTLDDIGPWKGEGLKPGHQGPISALAPVIAWTVAGINAGTTGRSAVMAWNGRGWHEHFRAPTTGYEMENLIFQSNPNARPRLWMSVGGDIISQQFPKDTLNPRNDKGIHYQHEAVMETGIIDMNAVQLSKLFGRVWAITKNLASSQAVIHAEYQLDDDIGSSNWISIGRFRRSPIDKLDIRRGNKHALKMRYRGLTQNSTVPTEMQAAVVKAVARTPTRRQWTVRAVTGDFQVDAQGLTDANPDDFYMWLQDAAVNTEPLLMRSTWEAMDNVYVYAEHPVLNRLYATPDGDWGGGLQLVVREIED